MHASRGRRCCAPPACSCAVRSWCPSRSGMSARDQPLIIDCHGHYTTAPGAERLARGAACGVPPSGRPAPAYPRHLRRRDPRVDRAEPAEAAARARRRHDDLLAARVGDGASPGRRAGQRRWTRACNDLIARVVGLYPGQLRRRLPAAAVAGRSPWRHSVQELERCVLELGFVGCNLNPTRRGGHWNGPPLTDRHWYPVLREDGRARRAGDGPRLGIVQPELPRHRRALHQRRYHRVHAVHRGGPLRRLSRRSSSSFRTAAARFPITGGATAGSPTCSSGRRSPSTS